MFLKGQCSVTRFLASGFFMNQFSPAPEYPINTVSNFFENLRRYSQAKVLHQYQRHLAANFVTSFTSVVDTGGKFATGVNNTGSK